MEQIGRRIWAIAEGHIPSRSVNEEHALISHEAACFLNATNEVAEVALTLFFTDREPAGPYRVRVPARRTLHLRFNDLTDPETGTQGHGLRHPNCVKRTDRGAVHSAGHAPPGDRPDFDNRVRLGLLSPLRIVPGECARVAALVV